MLKLKTLVIATAALAATAMPAFAQDILVVDMEKVYSQSRVGKHIQTQVKSMASTDEATLKSRASSLESTMKSLQPRVEGKDMNAIRADASLTSQLTDFSKRQNELARDAQVKQAELQYTAITARSKVDAKLKTIFDTIARERKASAILAKNAVLYVPNSSSVDITATVIQRLDSQMTTVSVARQSLPTR